MFISARFRYDRVPQGAGRSLPWRISASAAIDGQHVEVLEKSHPPDEDLDKWLALEGDRYSILSPNRPADDPIFLIATADTRLAFLRRVIEALEPFAVIRLVVRPATAEEPAWRPSAERQIMFDDATRETDEDLHFDLLRDASLSAAAGCPKALDLVNTPGLVGSKRIPLLADIFEGCQCAGDMDTLAALYWWMTFRGSRPARWLPWDPAVAEQLGEDATYEQLVRAMIARETSPVP